MYFSGSGKVRSSLLLINYTEFITFYFHAEIHLPAWVREFGTIYIFFSVFVRDIYLVGNRNV